jgi:hypothetical protein
MGYLEGRLALRRGESYPRLVAARAALEGCRVIGSLIHGAVRRLHSADWGEFEYGGLQLGAE